MTILNKKLTDKKSTLEKRDVVIKNYISLDPKAFWGRTFQTNLDSLAKFRQILMRQFEKL